MKKLFFIFCVSVFCYTEIYAQQWEPVNNTITGEILTATVFKSNLYVFSLQEKSISIYKKQDKDFVMAGEIRFDSIQPLLNFTTGVNYVYIALNYPKNNESKIYTWDGIEVKIISPDSPTTESFESFIEYKGMLFLSGNFLREIDYRIMQWDGKEWKLIGTPEDFWGPGVLFTYKDILYCILNDSYSQNASVYSYDGTSWKRVLKNKAAIQEVFAITEYNDQVFLFEGTNNRYFVFDGKKLSEKSCTLKFDNYGYTPYCLKNFKGKLFLGGQFWSEIETSLCVIYFDGKKWNAAGNGIRSRIASIVEFEGSLYIFGSLDSSGEIILNNIARYKE